MYSDHARAHKGHCIYGTELLVQKKKMVQNGFIYLPVLFSL